VENVPKACHRHEAYATWLDSPLLQGARDAMKRIQVKTSEEVWRVLEPILDAHDRLPTGPESAILMQRIIPLSCEYASAIQREEKSSTWLDNHMG